MWNCKHCKKEFNFKSTSEKANHSRWCDKNPKRNNTENMVNARNKTLDNDLGKLTQFSVKCSSCQESFKVEEREKQFPLKEKYFCNRKCANSTGGRARAKKLEENGTMNYRSIAEKYHKQECLVCGFDKIVEAHHVNEIHSDNRPENLVFLCPNHHKMFHSNYRDEVEPYIKIYGGLAHQGER